MLEEWGYFNVTGYNGTSWGGDCLSEVYDADLDGTNPATIGWSANGNDRECHLEG